jgi:hypothetical protein
MLGPAQHGQAVLGLAHQLGRGAARIEHGFHALGQDHHQLGVIEGYLEALEVEAIAQVSAGETERRRLAAHGLVLDVVADREVG